MKIKTGQIGMKLNDNYYKLVLEPKQEFVALMNQDLGRKEHLWRIAGLKPSGIWYTQSWLIDKKNAHVEKGKLIPDDSNIQMMLNKLPGEPRRISGNIFKLETENTVRKVRRKRFRTLLRTRKRRK